MPFCVVWWNLMLPCSILTGHQLSLRPVYPAHYSLVIHLLYEIKCHGITVLVFKSPLFYLIMVWKLKRGDAGNSDMSKRSYKVLPLSEMVKVIYLIRKENNHTLKWLSESESHSVKSDSLQPHGQYSPWNSPGQNTGVEWREFPFSRGSSQPKDRTQVSRIAGGFFTSWVTRGGG